MTNNIDISCNVVSIQNENGISEGTGFFIGLDGTILTCFHVVGRTSSSTNVRELKSSVYSIKFQNKEYPADCIFYPQQLDVAVLQLQNGKLPKNAAIFPLGTWESERVTSEFRTYGFRSANKFSGGLHARGMIQGVISSGTRLQLEPYSQGAEQLRSGMSGSPVFDLGTSRIVGMVCTKYRSVDNAERIPLAIPIKEIAKVWQPIASQFHEKQLYDELASVLGPEEGSYTGRWIVETLCPTLPAYFHISCDELQRNSSNQKPHLELLEMLKNNGKLYMFTNFLRQQYPDDKDFGKLTLPQPYFEFTNRVKELQDLRTKGNFIALDAPSGYGKTMLLRVVEAEYAAEDWLTVYTEIPRSPATLLGFVTAIQNVIGREGSKVFDSPEEMGKALAEQFLDVWRQLHPNNIDNQRQTKSSQEGGIVLFIDNIERLYERQSSEGGGVKESLAVDDFRSLLNIVLPVIARRIIDENMQLHIRVAGRYMATMKSELAVDAYHWITCTPFDFRNICRYTQKRGDAPSDGMLSEYGLLRAAHLMYITGGHPGGMAQILKKKMNYIVDPDHYFQDQFLAHQKITLANAEKIRSTIPDNLQDIFDKISFFRQFNYRLLDRLISDKVIDYSDDSILLAGKLLSTHLVERENRMLKDDIVRRILVIRTRINDLSQFKKLYIIARDYYEASLESATLVEVMIVETLYAHLQLMYHDVCDPESGVTTFKKRVKLADDFFSKTGKLETCLSVIRQRYEDEYEVTEVFNSLKNLIKSDWEFSFTLNYYLRQEVYSSAPTEKLLKRIDEYRGN